MPWSIGVCVLITADDTREGVVVFCTSAVMYTPEKPATKAGKFPFSPQIIVFLTLNAKLVGYKLIFLSFCHYVLCVIWGT